MSAIAAHESSTTARKNDEGFTLVELMITISIASAILVIAMPTLSGGSSDQLLKSASREASSALNQARAEAIRTGRVHIVFFGTDATGSALVDANGNPASILILDDGVPGTTNQNCRIDAGETSVAIPAVDGIDVGALAGIPAAPNDLGTGDRTSGSTFTDPSGNPAQWVMFRPEGYPLNFDAACTTGAVGDGAGAFYFKTEDRSAAVVLKPLGGARAHVIQAGTYTWSS